MLENCSGLHGSHEFADHTCQNCGRTVCHSCCAFDSRDDHAHDGDRPVMECPDCGANVLVHEWPELLPGDKFRVVNGPITDDNTICVERADGVSPGWWRLRNRVETSEDGWWMVSPS